MKKIIILTTLVIFNLGCIANADVYSKNTCKSKHISHGATIKCNSKKYQCIKKTCKQICSCEEAYFLLNQCGLKKLDRDRDGIPCESLCE